MNKQPLIFADIKAIMNIEVAFNTRILGNQSCIFNFLQRGIIPAHYFNKAYPDIDQIIKEERAFYIKR